MWAMLLWCWKSNLFPASLFFSLPRETLGTKLVDNFKNHQATRAFEFQFQSNFRIKSTIENSRCIGRDLIILKR